MKAPLWRLLGALVLLATLLGPLAVVGVTRLSAEQMRARGAPRTFREGGPAELLAELRRERELGLVGARGEASDAAAELNRRFPGDGRPGTGEAWWAQRDAFAAVLEHRADETWLEHPELTASLDTSELAGWRRYDHWAWREAPPYTHPAGAPLPCPLTEPTPGFASALWLGKVRLAQGLHAGELGPALAEVEHLAMLLDSTDTFLAAMVANALRREGWAMIGRARALGQAPPTPRWTAADLERQRAALYALVLLLRTDADPDVGRELGAEGAALPLVCAALNEAVLAGLLTHAAVEEPWPGELDQGAGARRVRAMLRAGRCPLGPVRRLWDEPEARDACLAGPAREEAPAVLLDLPWFRSPVAAILEGIATVGNPGPWGEDGDAASP